ncbi:hypothetical protein QOZ79_33880, partial [Pseudomonas aeruginosa]|uniref:hypothetical protein n=1 Tax=Pseudomonas aeruginosa TaxID=287 RepID=UPI00345B1A0C
GAVLLGAAAFVLFGILALDVSPLVTRWRRKVRTMKEERALRFAERRDAQAAVTPFSDEQADEEEVDLDDLSDEELADIEAS